MLVSISPVSRSIISPMVCSIEFALGLLLIIDLTSCRGRFDSIGAVFPPEPGEGARRRRGRAKRPRLGAPDVSIDLTNLTYRYFSLFLEPRWAKNRRPGPRRAGRLRRWWLFGDMRKP